jgi:hypothetical protein
MSGLINIMKKLIYVLFLILLVYRCTEVRDSINSPIKDKGSEYPPPYYDDNGTLIVSDEELLNITYAKYKLPDGFYNEQLLGGNIYYENTVSIKPANQRDGTWTELSTDNKDIARQWSDSSASYSSYYRDIVSEKETEKYYEFRRVYSINPSDVLLSRIHKYTYIDRSMFDYNKPGSIIGIFRKANFNAADVKELIEYLWFVRHYNNGSSKVYSSMTKDQPTEFVHSIYEIWIAYGDWGMRDVIRYIKHTYRINKGDGTISQEEKIIKEIRGSQN